MSALLPLLRTDIATGGPMPMSRYMHLCMSHPVHGYYQKADPLGAQGDFTTAPEISQLFGEMVGAWLLDVWHKLGKPAPFALVELGPGRGTLMADILRVLALDEEVAKAAQVHLVESSPALRKAQTKKLGDGLTHHETLDTLPAMPTLWIANEFFDALPTNQWVRTDKGWNARKIGLAKVGQDGEALAFGVDPTPLPAPKPSGDALPGTILEHSPAQDRMLGEIASHTLAHSGAGLIIDYGSLTPGFGDTLQAVKNHQKTDPLADPGDADLTTHVDFAHFAALLKKAGLPTITMGEQGAFLLAMGLLERAGQLGQNTPPDQQDAISLAVERLAGDAAMGKLFKVLGFASQTLQLAALQNETDPA